MLLLRHWHFTR